VSERTWTELFTVEHNHHIVLFACLGLAHDYVLSAIDRAQCLALPPTRFEQGWEVYHVVSFSEQRSRTLLKAVRDGGREVELLSKKRLTVRPMLNTRGAGVNALFDGLTEKQLDALVQAHRHGLYASPRRTTAANIADGLGVSRSTYEEHLRKAESRLVGNLVPYLELYLKAQRATQAGQN
jgi:predicted DNA binding protein